MKFKLLTAALLTIAPLTAGYAMNIDTFLQKAAALEKKGMTALFSPDLKLLKREIEGAAGQLKAERDAAVKAGTKTAYCPPSAKGSLDSKEVLTHFRAIPAAQQARTPVKDGLRSLLARKYPCR
jgi:hypothetical protein